MMMTFVILQKYHQLTKAEIIGFLFGIAGVWLTIRKSIWCFPAGIVNVVITAWLVLGQQLYADVLQQAVYLILLIYGWIAWISGRQEQSKEITLCNPKLRLYLLVCGTGASFLMGYLLKNKTDAAYPYLDSTGTIISFVAQWMIAVKKLENWYLWIVANVMYIGIYYLKDMPLYSALSGVYLVMAVIGLIEWKKIILQQKDLRNGSA
jgi:nicotinamide mononucleotide transporter